ncbi:MAG: aminomethyl-transferring glycine dehydrogenase [Candidatus Azobacteroides sp.]|nr:aminomethyl-transferring glycine dehydrogenase [Candidatus Azobacteroides sp.]
MGTERFFTRHIGIRENDWDEMLEKIKVSSLDELIDQTIPENIRLKKTLNLPKALSEDDYAEHIGLLAGKNKVFTSYIGMGWYETATPAPILRNVFENPCWYTSYTPYQAEISQGRLEALLNFQTMVSDLTGLPLSNSSLLDEATAAAEAATMMFGLRSREKQKSGANILLADKNIFPQTLAVLHTRCISQGIELKISDCQAFEFSGKIFGVMLQYPDADGKVENYSRLTEKAKAADCKVAVATDLLSLCLLVPPGEWGADIAFGSSQRFGVPMYYGGPSAGFFSAKDEYKRHMPGRIIGISKDAYGKQALRMALQTREQHIKREKATSNICTAQALLATMAGFYAVYHGPDGLKNIASGVHSIAVFFAEQVGKLGYKQLNKNYFDTLKLQLPSNVSTEVLRHIAVYKEINLRYFETGEVGISFDETTSIREVNALLSVFASAAEVNWTAQQEIPQTSILDEEFVRTSRFLQDDVFLQYHSETELMRYIKKLERRDISLTHSMISLGSCTMKLNAASELLPLNHPGFRNIHPFAPADQVEGYRELTGNLSEYLGEITGLPGVSLQPNSGAAGEYAGLRVIGEYLKSIGQEHRNTVLIPASAHGTNPASAVQAGFEVVVVKCDENGNVDIDDLRGKAELYRNRLAAFMITYPSTHGIFEPGIREMCEMIHRYGGQVYMDGANMNAQVGLTNPGFIGADVCHLNLHKTFAVPHGGGGPGAGPICAAKHLIPFLPQHPAVSGTLNTVSSAPFGSAGILPVSYGYIRMMGADGLTAATKIAILNANYLAAFFDDTYGVVYKGKNDRVGHEMILECRKLKVSSGISETDVAKRLIDYGFHAPTLSFPVAGTLMIEPTESESLAELKRFVEAMHSIYDEIKEVESGVADKEDNVLINAPHPQYEVCADEWNHSYSRQKAAFPLERIQENKFWVNVARVDNAFGDRNLVATRTYR